MKNVLVLCTGNSARSILGEALLARLGNGRLASFSAGSDPKGAVHPAAIKLLASKLYETNKFSSKSWDVFTQEGAPSMDIVITVCDSAGSQACPVWIGAPVQSHWGIFDPAKIEGIEQEQAFLRAYQELEERISKLVDLPFETMDNKLLKTTLDNIGATSSGATKMASGGSKL